MSAPAKLVAFAVGLVLAFALGFGAGEIVGPFERSESPSHQQHEGRPE